jgi:hypothetical protein
MGTDVRGRNVLRRIYLEKLMILQGYLMYSILIFVNIAIYVMVQMYFEGHKAFNEIKRLGDYKKL